MPFIVLRYRSCFFPTAQPADAAGFRRSFLQVFSPGKNLFTYLVDLRLF